MGASPSVRPCIGVPPVCGPARCVSMAVVCPLSPTPTGEGPREVWALSTTIIGCKAIKQPPAPWLAPPNAGKCSLGSSCRSNVA